MKDFLGACRLLWLLFFCVASVFAFVMFGSNDSSANSMPTHSTFTEKIRNIFQSTEQDAEASNASSHIDVKEEEFVTKKEDPVIVNTDPKRMNEKNSSNFREKLLKTLREELIKNNISANSEYIDDLENLFKNRDQIIKLLRSTKLSRESSELLKKMQDFANDIIEKTYISDRVSDLYTDDPESAIRAMFETDDSKVDSEMEEIRRIATER